MIINRRAILLLAGASLFGDPASPETQIHAVAVKLKAVVFDGFAIFDPRPVGDLAESLFPGQGQSIMNAWRVRQFEYQWLHALSGQYVDFLQTTKDSLIFAFAQQRLPLADDKMHQLLAKYAELRVWPDALAAVARLRQHRLRLAFLSNMTRAMLEAAIARNEMQGMFQEVISTDSIRSYKPDPRAYQLAMDKLQLSREEILFVAFAGWDAAGAKWFGYPTFWVNRADSAVEELGVTADSSGRDLPALIRFLERIT
jgi:2-haloacid dehalogenase